MSSTPFIDSLGPSAKEKVNRETRGQNRPSYFSAEVSRANALNPSLRSEKALPDPNIQISYDTEAVLILLGPDTKKALIDFINVSLLATVSDDDIEMFKTMIGKRRVSYTYTVSGSLAPALAFDRARAALLSFLEGQRQTMVDEDDTESDRRESVEFVLPQVGHLLSAISSEYASLTKPEVMAVHNVVLDAQVLYDLTDNAADRKSELLSWRNILTTYL